MSYSSVGSLDRVCFGSYFPMHGAVEGCQLVILHVNDSQCIFMKIVDYKTFVCCDNVQYFCVNLEI